MLNEHTHEVIPKNIISRQIVNFRLKRKCENDLLTRPNKIIRQELRNTENDIQPKRRKNLQQIPKSLEEAITQLFDGRENITTNTGELFCHMKETSSPIIFTCKTNLELLSQSFHIFADGTFSYMHPNILNNCIQYIYYKMSAHNAVRHFFPNCKIMAYRFHLGQSWFRKIQSDSNLLKNYNSKSELGFYTSHPSIHQVIHILLDIQSETYLKTYSIKQQIINKPRKEQEENIAFIINTWEKYKINEISLNDYLLTLGPRFFAKNYCDRFFFKPAGRLLVSKTTSEIQKKPTYIIVKSIHSSLRLESKINNT
ncbi:Uncharacterized protein FWK35_00013911 [Aphis craccivora]|uniref:MULE domain-containing protein n=1 Tax=Aphis craccivora TaxID=307492 RepID=A0A6G0Z6V9_APHCR|nr:Uncharacterized protein FWK35_00013911 [Aphis craccivora]